MSSSPSDQEVADFHTEHPYIGNSTTAFKVRVKKINAAFASVFTLQHFYDTVITPQYPGAQIVVQDAEIQNGEKIPIDENLIARMFATCINANKDLTNYYAGQRKRVKSGPKKVTASSAPLYLDDPLVTFFKAYNTDNADVDQVAKKIAKSRYANRLLLDALFDFYLLDKGMKGTKKGGYSALMIEFSHNDSLYDLVNAVPKAFHAVDETGKKESDLTSNDNSRTAIDIINSIKTSAKERDVRKKTLKRGQELAAKKGILTTNLSAEIGSKYDALNEIKDNGKTIVMSFYNLKGIYGMFSFSINTARQLDLGNTIISAMETAKQAIDEDVNNYNLAEYQSKGTGKYKNDFNKNRVTVNQAAEDLKKSPAFIERDKDRKEKAKAAAGK